MRVRLVSQYTSAGTIHVRSFINCATALDLQGVLNHPTRRDLVNRVIFLAEGVVNPPAHPRDGIE